MARQLQLTTPHPTQPHPELTPNDMFQRAFDRNQPEMLFVMVMLIVDEKATRLPKDKARSWMRVGELAHQAYQRAIHPDD